MSSSFPTPGGSPLFTNADARATGLTRSSIAHALRKDRLVRPCRGVYVPAEVWHGDDFDAERRRAMLRAEAAVRLVVPSFASHICAAVLAGLPAWELPDRACVTVTPRYTGDSACAHLHRAGVPAEHVVRDAAIPRLTTTRTILDIAREHGLEDAVVVGDRALRDRMTDEARLGACAEYCANWPGIRRARKLLELLDRRSESPLESVSRLRLSCTRLPAPELQPDIVDINGVFLGRPDFYFDEFGVAGEVDGRVKYVDRPDEVVWRERQRQAPMEDTGLIFVRWGRSDLEDMPRLVSRIETVFARGARRPHGDRSWRAILKPRHRPR
jgi:hypothetical protein